MARARDRPRPARRLRVDGLVRAASRCLDERDYFANAFEYPFANCLIGDETFLALGFEGLPGAWGVPSSYVGSWWRDRQGFAILDLALAARLARALDDPSRHGPAKKFESIDFELFSPTENLSRQAWAYRMSARPSRRSCTRYDP